MCRTISAPSIWQQPSGFGGSSEVARPLPGRRSADDRKCSDWLMHHLVRFAHKATAGRVSLLRTLYHPAHRWYFSRQAMATVLHRVGFDQIRFYREQTVNEFGQQKGRAYGMLQNWPYRIAMVVMKVVPVLRNKMVVVAVKSSYIDPTRSGQS
jgi:hypothetical protein